jgi:D-alanyl-lipoteichoic acid acyltransferase DltB (MBOAT superfamily)
MPCGTTAFAIALEHAVKVPAAVAAVALAANASACPARLLGVPALTPMDAPWAASTPADFWRRWNLPAQRFFHPYAFRPAGGPRRPILATLAAFAASGLTHEYVFGAAAGRLQGRQMLFFMLQGCAAAATMRVRPRGRAAAAWTLGTMAFDLLTAVLFFRSVDAVPPFYVPRTDVPE